MSNLNNLKARPTRIVVALGGNALEEKGLPPTAESQRKVVEKTAEHLAELACQGFELAIVHGNGPQIGRILLASEFASEITPALPFDVCGSMSQGYIGYHIQQALTEALRKRGKDTPVVSIITQVVVDKNDPAFENPTKPIGPFYSKEEADKIAKEKGYTMKEDAGRGYRRVVASPKPKQIVEIDTLKTLWETTIAIACGGGGIPVVKDKDGSLKGIAAVIDKDLAATELAKAIDADILMILTEVENVAVNWQKPNEQIIKNISTDDLEQFAEEGHFAPGSMLPKVRAAIDFARSDRHRNAIITSLDNCTKAINGLGGTIVYNSLNVNQMENESVRSYQ